MSSERRPYCVGDGRGVAYARVPPEIEAALPRWMASGSVDGAQELKPGRVWRVGAFAVKRFDAARLLARVWRKAPALRCADRVERITPIETPRRLLVLEVVRGPRRGESWLVVDFVDGRHLADALRGDPAAAAALPGFFAQMHARDVLHGDLNAANLLWNGRAWNLIDLEGLRGPLHRLRKGAIVADQWARVAGTLRDPEFVRPLHARYCALLSRAEAAQGEWPAIERRARRLAQRYDRLLGERARAAQT